MGELGLRAAGIGGAGQPAVGVGKGGGGAGGGDGLCEPPLAVVGEVLPGQQRESAAARVDPGLTTDGQACAVDDGLQGGLVGHEPDRGEALAVPRRERFRARRTGRAAEDEVAPPADAGGGAEGGAVPGTVGVAVRGLREVGALVDIEEAGGIAAGIGPIDLGVLRQLRRGGVVGPGEDVGKLARPVRAVDVGVGEVCCGGEDVVHAFVASGGPGVAAGPVHGVVEVDDAAAGGVERGGGGRIEEGPVFILQLAALVPIIVVAVGDPPAAGARGGAHTTVIAAGVGVGVVGVGGGERAGVGCGHGRVGQGLHDLLAPAAGVLVAVFGLGHDRARRVAGARLGHDLAEGHAGLRQIADDDDARAAGAAGRGPLGGATAAAAGVGRAVRTRSGGGAAARATAAEAARPADGVVGAGPAPASVVGGTAGNPRAVAVATVDSRAAE